jgi:hypothetical protein
MEIGSLWMGGCGDYSVIIGATLRTAERDWWDGADVKVDLVYLVCLVEPDELEKPDELDKPPTKRMAFINILSAGWNTQIADYGRRVVP